MVIFGGRMSILENFEISIGIEPALRNEKRTKTF